MKMMTKTTLAMLALGISAIAAQAQAGPGNPNQNGGGFDGPPRGHRPPAPAIIVAIDVNHDGVIDADEMANAPAVLAALDKNGDGVLTPDEFVGVRPPRPSQDGPDANGRDQRGFGGPPDGFPPGPPPDRN